MNERRTVQLLIERVKESLDNAPGAHVTPETAGIAVNRCLGCQSWDRGCVLLVSGNGDLDVESWIELLITPGRGCEWRPKPPPKS